MGADSFVAFFGIKLALDPEDEDAIDALINQINTDSDSDTDKVKNKSKKVNSKNKKLKKTKKSNTDTDENTDNKNIVNDKTNKKRFYLPFNIPTFIRDPLLIWILFIILSQNFIKQLIGKYVKYINPNEEGVVKFTGVVIYGLIFAVLFGLIKFLLGMIF